MEIKHVLLIVNQSKPEADLLVNEISDSLSGRGIKVSVFGICGKPGIPDLDGIDCVFSLGGDGTVLFSARAVFGRNIPVLAVNLGAFGFITEIAKHEWLEAFTLFSGRDLGVSERILVDVCVLRKGSVAGSFRGLNDAVVAGTGISKVIYLNVSLGDTFLGKYRADGIIIATPTGSTAYSAAAGGPILAPEMEALIINPICPFTLSNRPLVVQGNKNIYIDIEDDRRTDLILTIDGQIVFPLEPADRICIKKTEKKVGIIRSNRRNFYEVLRSKLNWSGGPDA